MIAWRRTVNVQWLVRGAGRFEMRFYSQDASLVTLQIRKGHLIRMFDLVSLSYFHRCRPLAQCRASRGGKPFERQLLLHASFSGAQAADLTAVSSVKISAIRVVVKDYEQEHNTIVSAPLGIEPKMVEY